MVAEPAPMRFAFAHGLFREVLYADLGARRLAIHRRVAETLERIHADNPAAPVAEIARHWLAAGPATALRARDTARRAAERASAALAHEEAAALLEHALSAHEQAQPANDSLRVELLVELAEAQTRTGDIVRGKSTSMLAAQLALAHGASISPGFVDRELVLLLEEARARLIREDERALRAAGPGCCASVVCTPTAGLQARILARLASAKQSAPDPQGPLTLAREALTLLPEVCADVRLSVLHAAIGAMMDIAHPHERRPLNEEAARIAHALGEREILLRTLVRLVFDHADAGDLAGAREQIAEVDALARQFPRPSARVPGALARSMLALLRGDRVEHETNFEEALRLAEGEPSFLSVLWMHRLGAARMCDRNDELARDRDEFVASLAPWSNYAAAFDASIAARRGDVRAASAALARLDRAHLRSCMDTYLLNWVAEGAAAVGNAELGELLEAALAAHAGEWASVSLPGFIIEGPVSGLRALAALARGASDDSERFRREALAEATRAGADAVVARLSRDLNSQAGARVRAREACAPVPSAAFEREGEYWTVSGEGGSVRLKDSRGLAMLARLVSEPGCEIAALELERRGSLPVDNGDSGELLDEQARAHYRRRLLELAAELDEAEAWNDPARANRARAESEALRAELSRAVGLDGRVRRAGRAAERAHVNVQRRITDAIDRIEKHNAALGQHLSLAVRTGAYVSYLPARARRADA